MTSLPLLVGRRATRTLLVTEEHTARTLGSGDLLVLGTPALVAVCEAATVAAVSAGLPANSTTVGTRVDIEHVAASRVGATVEAQARLVEVDGRRLRFEVIALDEGREVGRGTVARVVVDRERFLAALPQ